MTQDCPVGLRAVRRKLSRVAAAVLALISSLATVASGQEKSRKKDSFVSQTRITQKDIVSNPQDALTGQVLDPQGAVVVGAAVTMEHLPSKEILKTRTGAKGRFQFVGLRPGKYLVKISSPGFIKHWLEDLEIKNNQATTVDVILWSIRKRSWWGLSGLVPQRTIRPGLRQ
jgi:Carboxypeptidase regulatory-like domain